LESRTPNALSLSSAYPTAGKDLYRPRRKAAVSRKSDKAKLTKELWAERPRSEIDLIADRIREKLAEEQRTRDIQRLLREQERLQTAVYWWRSFAITLMLTLVGTVVAVVLYFCGLIVRLK
jgi:hypothetical protein